MIEVIPTNTCPPDFAELAHRSEAFLKFAPHVQLDIDDGIFAPEISWPYKEGQWKELESMIEKGEKLPYVDILKYEIHLMVEEPLHIGELLARMGASRILAHIESFKSDEVVQKTFATWRAAGVSEIGLAIRINTPLERLEPFIAAISAVQIMSIATLGKQGAPFDPHAVARIQTLHEKHPSLTIAVDGGVSEQNIASLARAGARRFGVGSAISKAENPAHMYRGLLVLAESAIQS